MRIPLTTPHSETVTQWELTNFRADLATNLFTVTVQLTNTDGTIVRERTFGGALGDLGLLSATIADIRAKIRLFLIAQNAID